MGGGHQRKSLTEALWFYVLANSLLSPIFLPCAIWGTCFLGVHSVHPEWKRVILAILPKFWPKWSQGR